LRNEILLAICHYIHLFLINFVPFGACRYFAKLLLSTDLVIWVSNPSPRTTIWPKRRRCPVIGIGTFRKFLARIKGRIKENKEIQRIKEKKERNSDRKNCILERGRMSVKGGEAHYVRHSFTCRASRWCIAMFAEIFKPVGGRKRGTFQEVASTRPVLASLGIHGRYAARRKQTCSYLVNTHGCIVPKTCQWRHQWYY